MLRFFSNLPLPQEEVVLRSIYNVRLCHNTFSFNDIHALELQHENLFNNVSYAFFSIRDSRLR